MSDTLNIKQSSLFSQTLILERNKKKKGKVIKKKFGHEQKNKNRKPLPKKK
jgi:hypothetical protein